MSRLTNKDYQERVGNAFYCLVDMADINPNDVCKFPVKQLREQELKLGQLEDIEEELGIDLTIYFGALKNGVYYYSNSQLTKDFVYPISNFLTDYNDKLSYSFMTKFEHRLLSFDDYGKTWALTKEELL